jgi:hypothetical protein
VGIKKFLTLLKNNSLIRRSISAFVKPILYKFANPYVLTPIEQGNWHGNNTLWRTILDLNLIARYADKRGEISKGQKRKFFFLIDGIIAGEAEGPLQNKPKTIGLIAASDSSVQLDRILTKMMGFNPEKIPHIKRASEMQEFTFHLPSSEEINISSNLHNPASLNFRFRPPNAWNNIKL